MIVLLDKLLHWSAMRIASRRTTIVLLLVAGSWNALRAQDEKVPQSIPELQLAIEAVLKETRTPGAAIAIVSRDKEEWMTGTGLADVSANKPATAETLFRIGSVTKGFAALSALKLQEEGKLKLTDTVKQWVPEVAFTNPWEASDPVRLVHLMEHTSGFDDIHFREYAHNDPTPVTLKDALAYGAASRRSRWRPGSRRSYCNSGPAVLAAVVEKVSGQRFEDFVQEHFFNPLRMDTASYFHTPEVEQRLTKLYRSDGVTPYPYWHIAYRSTGSVNASAKDMANYVRFYLQRGSLDNTQLLQRASIERMETMETLPSAKLGNVGYGLFNRASFDGPFVFRGHAGGLMGGLTEMEYLPEHGRGYALMINSGNNKTLFQIAKLLRQYVVRDLPPPVLPAVASVPATVRQHYEGYYQVCSPREQCLYGFARLLKVQKLTFTADGITTTIYGFRREQWVPVSERAFRKADESVPTLALLPDADGETLIEQTRWETMKKVSALQVWAQVIAITLTVLLMLSSIVFAPVWGFRKLLGSLHHAGPLSVRVLPLLSVVLLITFEGLLAMGLWGMLTGNYVDNVVRLGVPSLLTLSIMLSSIAFPLATATSLCVIYRERSAAMNRITYWYSVLVTLAMTGVAVYLGYWDLIGLRLWA